MGDGDGLRGDGYSFFFFFRTCIHSCSLILTLGRRRRCSSWDICMVPPRLRVPGRDHLASHRQHHRPSSRCGPLAAVENRRIRLRQVSEDSPSLSLPCVETSPPRIRGDGSPGQGSLLPRASSSFGPAAVDDETRGRSCRRRGFITLYKVPGPLPPPVAASRVRGAGNARKTGRGAAHGHGLPSCRYSVHLQKCPITGNLRVCGQRTPLHRSVRD